MECLAKRAQPPLPEPGPSCIHNHDEKTSLARSLEVIKSLISWTIQRRDQRPEGERTKNTQTLTRNIIRGHD